MEMVPPGIPVLLYAKVPSKGAGPKDQKAENAVRYFFLEIPEKEGVSLEEGFEIPIYPTATYEGAL